MGSNTERRSSGPCWTMSAVWVFGHLVVLKINIIIIIIIIIMSSLSFIIVIIVIIIVRGVGL